MSLYEMIKEMPMFEKFSEKEKKAFLERMKKHFNKEKIIAEKSIEKIENILGEENE